MRPAILGLAIGFMAIACRQTTEPPVALSVQIEANTTVVPRGDTVTFEVTAAGNNLVGVVIDYGDSSSDIYATSGALTARVTFKHAYSGAGSFTVRATVTDAVAGVKEATVALVVN
jgi:hypothetical protein